MIPYGLKEQFEFYRKWFKTLLVREFLNLPSNYQIQFINMVKKFLEDCNKVHEEGKNIKEKLIELTIIGKNKTGDDSPWTLYCISPGLKHKVTIQVFKESEPEIGTKQYHTVYSVDGKVWHSSKEELIRKLNHKE